MKVMFLTPVKVNGDQYGIYDIAELSEEDAQKMLDRGWGIKVADDKPTGSSHFKKPKPVATLRPDPQPDKE